MATLTQPAETKFTPEQRRTWCKNYLARRERGRTDLLWLCNHVLGYTDVNPRVHGPVAAHQQQFRGREEYMDEETFTIKFSAPRCGIHASGECLATCFGRSMWTLPGPRYRMLLDPRGHFKTTVNTIAHGIQWLLNFEDARVAISVATFKPRGIEIVTEIEEHFRFNERFRFLYPEWCPPAESAASWGNLDGFDLPNRKTYRSTKSLNIVSIGNQSTGSRYDVIKNSDLVNEINSKTDAGLREAKQHFMHMIPLLERGAQVEGRDTTRGWMDLEGTIFNHSDLYCEQLEADERRIREGRSCRWSVLRRDGVIDEAAYEKIKAAKNRSQAAADMGERYKSVTLFFEKFPARELIETEEDMDEYTFNCQYRLNPKSRATGLADRLLLFPAQFRKENLPRYRMVKCTVDLAGMEEDSDGCNTALVTCGHDRDGRKDVLDAIVGHFNPFQVIEQFFRIDRLFSTGMKKVQFQIEKAHHAQVLLPFLEREMEKRQHRLQVTAIPRDTSVSKDNRIWGLQSWFKRGLIRFADDLECLAHIEKEIFHFPNYKFKDFLDALSDQLQTKDGKLDYEATVPDAPKYSETDLYRAYHLKGAFVGFDPQTRQPVWDYSEDGEAIFGTSGMVISDSRVAARMYSAGVA